MSKKLAFSSGAILVSGLLLATSALAAGPRGWGGRSGQGMPAAAGTVTAVSGSSLTLSGRNGTTYTIDGTNAVVLNNGATSQLSAIQVNDTVAVFGTVNGTAITATRILDGQLPNPKGNFGGRGKYRDGSINGNAFNGTVGSINGTSFTLNARGRSSTTLTVQDASAAFTKNGQAASARDLASGQQVKVTGTLDTAGQTVAATAVNIIIPMPAIRLTGTVQGIAGAVLTVTASNGTVYTVDVTAAKVSYSRGHQATAAMIQVGDKVSVSGKLLSGSTNVTATTVRDLSRTYTGV